MLSRSQVATKFRGLPRKLESCTKRSPHGPQLRGSKPRAVAWRGSSLMLIEAGYDIAFQCPAQTPMLLQLNVHPSREATCARPTSSTPTPLAMRAYLDHYGNRVTRVEVPAGLVTSTIASAFTTRASPTKSPPMQMTPIAGLPDEVLLYLVSSRYCDSDNLADFAWSKFHTISGGLSARRRSAISSMRRSASATPRRAPPAPPATRCAKASASAAISPISRSRSVAA